MNLFRNKVFTNMSWIIVCKLGQSIFNLIISMITARYLGPSNFGVLNYAASITTIFLPFVQLGFCDVLVNEFKKHPDEEGKILGTALIISFISSLFCFMAISGLIRAINYNDEIKILVTLLYSISLVFNSLDLFCYWFQSKLLSKYTSIVSLIVYIVISLYKVYLLISQKKVEWFAISNALDYLLINIILSVIYKIKGGQKLSISWEIGLRTLSTSKHFVIPAIMIVIYGQTDKIMLANMISNEATGYYSAAYQCATMTSFVFSAIIASFKPVIFEAKKNNQSKRYCDSISLLYGIIAYLSLAQGLLFTFIPQFIISIIYGSGYQASTTALSILGWVQAFSYFGTVKDSWALAEDKQKYLWIFYLSGAILNIILNAILIPAIGIVGAAIATLITQFVVNFVFGFIFKPFRENGHLMLKGINPYYLIRKIMSILKNSKVE